MRGWAKFGLTCSVGMLANVGVAAVLVRFGFHEYPAAITGIIIGSVWNFALSSKFVWGRYCPILTIWLGRHRSAHRDPLEADGSLLMRACIICVGHRALRICAMRSRRSCMRTRERELVRRAHQWDRH
jgi:hypothetical protein